ncbi:MAG: porin [Candidatus Eisenbacteria bacterium]|nr:porin [Candidatus Eisenbacteria bacterium]
MKAVFQVLLISTLIAAVAAPAVADPTFYGYIKLDASYDSAETNDGNFVYYVLPYDEGDENDEFNMTAKQTRLGATFEGPDSDAVAASGRIEFDFYGGGGENKPNPMLRHAYLELRTSAVDILAGQTSDVISPIVPTTLNYIVLWKSGDIGYRRPQIRVSRKFDLGDAAGMSIAAAATRSMGSVDGGGETTGVPALQGRVALSANLPGDRPAEIGFSGLMGREEVCGYEETIDATPVVRLNTETHELDQTVVAVDVTVPLGGMATLKGQYFTGKNLGKYLGGVGQGVAEVVAGVSDTTVTIVPEEIEASGWWAQLNLKPSKRWQVNVGAGVDDPELPEDDRANSLEKNSTYYGNVIWNVAPSASIGVEYAMFETEYRVAGGDEDSEPTTESYENRRLQLSFQYKF